MTLGDARRVHAEPTKEFFISMLVKDIELSRAILDLVDNSVDGARRSRIDENFQGLSVRLDVSPVALRIADNCGGIPVDIARRYAFRFGRPEDMETTRHSIGQFGVGMKRALFKLGTRFRIESTTVRSRFVIEEDVDEWKHKAEWEFEFKEIEENGGPYGLDQQGTTITVTSLHESVQEDFILENFQNRLADEIRQAHQDAMNKGLAVTHNGVPVQFRPSELLSSDELRPAFREMSLPADDGVKVKAYAGIAESNPSAAGWYIFCNGRLVLGREQTIVTGWGEGDGRTIPKYHNQFARFRGYAFFDSDDAALLPWNTTKTGVDGDSPVYRSVRQVMITLMRPVIDFLNRLDAEASQQETDHKPLQDALARANASGILSARTSEVFLWPKIPLPPALPRTGRIQYSKPVERIDRIKRVLRVGTLREVGEGTFEYFYERECRE